MADIMIKCLKFGGELKVSLTAPDPYSAYHCLLDLNAGAQDAAINRLRH
jgi:hypothetical protein